MEANNWVTLRFYDFDDTLPELLPTATWENGEYMAKGIGISGNDELYVGIKPYYNRAGDYYNLNLQGQVGFADTIWSNQVSRMAFSIGTHNLELEYFITCNAQRIMGAIKMNTNYQHFYLGKVNSYVLPHEWPYPLAVAGTGAESTITRYSGRTGHPYREIISQNPPLLSLFSTRKPEGWSNTSLIYPFAIAAYQTGNNRVYPTTYDLATKYTLHPAYFYYGELEGVYWVSGYNLQAEDTITVGTKTFICLPIATSRAIGDYIALSME
jgi:hypothetical protein